MKILFIGDYSGLHATLARCLRAGGHDVTLISDRGVFMNTESDRFLYRRPGIIGSASYLFNSLVALREWKNYDVVQLINPNFLRLRPSKLEYFFKKLKSNNRMVCLTLAGNDYHFVRACVEGQMFRYSEFRVGEQLTSFAINIPERERGWLSSENCRYATMVYENIDGAMAVLPEYFIAAAPWLGDRLYYTGIPIEISQATVARNFELPIKLFAGIKSGMELQKGFDKILPAVNRLCDRHPDRFCLEVVRDLPLSDYLATMSKADIVLDQLYSYSPATNALQGMSMGCITASGAEPEFYDMIGENVLRPVVRLNPFIDIEKELSVLIEDRDMLATKSVQGIEFVKRHNDVNIVADRFVSCWNSLKNK